MGVEVGGMEWRGGSEELPKKSSFGPPLRSYGRTFRDSRPGVVGLPPRKDPNHSFRQRGP